MELKLNVSGHCNPAPCQEEPVAYDGPRMEVVEWKCRVCKKESIAFYDLDLIVEKNERSMQLREKLFSDDAFRALCVKKARYDRIQGMSVKTHREKAERCLRRLYGKHTQFPVTDYAALFLRLRALPDEVERTTIAQCLERHGQVLLHNEPYQIPGMKEIAGKRFMRPDKHNFVTHEWPLKRYFFAMNRRLLRYGIAWARFFKNEGADGIVSGFLAPELQIDEAQLQEFMNEIAPLPFTFHRAFDVIADKSAALEVLIRAGCARVLSSGGAPTALEGAEGLNDLHKQSAGRIIILPGGGIRAAILPALLKRFPATEIHTAALAPGTLPKPIASREELEGMLVWG